jgi:hypothetical protein
VGLWTTQKHVAHKPHRPNNSKQRTFDVLQNPDIFTRYGHFAFDREWRWRFGGCWSRFRSRCVQATARGQARTCSWLPQDPGRAHRVCVYQNQSRAPCPNRDLHVQPWFTASGVMFERLSLPFTESRIATGIVAHTHHATSDVLHGVRTTSSDRWILAAVCSCCCESPGTGAPFFVA